MAFAAKKSFGRVCNKNPLAFPQLVNKHQLPKVPFATGYNQIHPSNGCSFCIPLIDSPQFLNVSLCLFTSRIIMPTSYLTSKPPTTPPLSRWLAWTQKELANINPNLDQVTALIGLDKKRKTVIIFKPVPIVKPAGILSAIIGNTTNKKSEPAFIKIDGTSVGSTYVLKEFNKIPANLCPEIPLPPKMIKDTVWKIAQKSLGFCLFSNLAPIPFGMTIIEEFTSNDKFIKSMRSISKTHGEWATLISSELHKPSPMMTTPQSIK